jgi:hypothetical protein
MFDDILMKINLEYPEIEIKNVDYTVLDKVSSLIREMYNELNSICQSKKYSFVYYFVFKLNFEKRAIIAHVSAFVGKKMNTFSIQWVMDVEYPVIKPQSSSLFVWVYEKVLMHNACRDLEKAKELLNSIANRENLKFHVTRDSRANSNVYALEIPLKVDIFEYNVV